MFSALLVEKDDAGYRAQVRPVDDALLGTGEVTVRVEYSTINYKDALAITGKSPVIRRFPLIAGIDFSGVVEHSADPRYQAGDRVLLNGYGVGESHPGGLAQRARVKADWLVPLPTGLSTSQAMAIGTAGYTAMLSVLALQRHGLTPASGDMLVTGASGGVGSIALSILAGLGFRVIASTGRTEEAPYLKSLGAAEVIAREELSSPGKPLAKERWAGVVDSVGSHTLANACAGTRYGGALAACGLAQGMDFPGSVAPFILRGVTLYGIDSVLAPQALRREAWERLARELDHGKLASITREITLDQAVGAANDVLAGRIRGRVVVDVNG